MSAIRLPLLCAFAGGCLSNLVLFGVWRAMDSSGAAPPHHAHHVVELAAPASAAPPVEQRSGLVAANAVEQKPDAEHEPALGHAAQDLDSGGPTPAGSAVSDVLTQLEAAYRERVAARPPAPGAPNQEHLSAAAPADSAPALAEPPPSGPPPVSVQASPVVAAVVPAAVEPRVSAVAPVAPVAAAPVAVVPPAAPVVAAQAAAEPAFAPPDAPPPTQVHYGDVNQNTYITNVRQGDVYVVQMQQLALLQYMQLLGLSRGAVAPARHVMNPAPQRFPSGITNPDNPWGFHFAPLNLVH